MAAAPSLPDAGRTPGAAIVQVKGPARAPAELQAQSTSEELPAPEATVAPDRSVTVTVHGSAEDSCARKRTGPPITPITSGP